MAWFLRDRRLSEFAVRKTSELLRKEGYENEIVDEKGHDIRLKDGRKIEVKFDTTIYDSGNLACEWWSDENKKHEGWAQYSDADILVYMYDFDNAYVLDMQELKKYVEKNRDNLTAKPAYRGRTESRAIVLLVPIKSVSDLRIKEFEKIFVKSAVLPQRE